MCCNVNNPCCCTISFEVLVLQVELLSEVKFWSHHDLDGLHLISASQMISNDWNFLHIRHLLQKNQSYIIRPCIYLGGVRFIFEQVTLTHSCLIHFTLIYLHFDDYLFCHQSSKKGEIVGAMMLPPYVLEIVDKQFGTNVFASAHRVTGPWRLREVWIHISEG